MFDFDLQVFNDGDMGDVVAEVAPAESSPDQQSPQSAPAIVQEQPQQTQEPSQIAQPQQSSRQPGEGDVYLYTDPATGKSSIRVWKQADQVQSQSPVDLQPQEQQAVALQPYTESELLSAASTGSVDESRIPPQFQRDWATYKHNMAMHLAQQQQQLAQQQLQQQQQQLSQQQLQQQQQPNTALNAHKQVAQQAFERTLKELGLNQNDFETLEYGGDTQEMRLAFEAAYNRNVNAIYDVSRREQEQAASLAAEVSAAYQEIQPVLNEALSDPHWNEINELMGERYKTMPYADAVQVEAALRKINTGIYTRNELPVLKSYYDLVRKEFYGKQNGITSTPKPAPKRPPTVETSGSGAAAAEPQFDFTKMRDMNRKERSTFLRDWNKSRMVSN